MITTPRTDDEARKIWSEGNYGMGDDYVEEVVDADFARGLEEEIAKLESEKTQLMDACPPPCSAVIARITQYMTTGGALNPELADHIVVRDLLIDCRDVLWRYKSVTANTQLQLYHYGA